MKVAIYFSVSRLIRQKWIWIHQQWLRYYSWICFQVWFAVWHSNNLICINVFIFYSRFYTYHSVSIAANLYIHIYLPWQFGHFLFFAVFFTPVSHCPGQKGWVSSSSFHSSIPAWPCCPSGSAFLIFLIILTLRCALRTFQSAKKLKCVIEGSHRRFESNPVRY